MTPEQWLVENGKKPYCTGDFDIWYWAPDSGKDNEDHDFSVPFDIFERLSGRKMYPDVKGYKSEAEAIEDFCRVWRELQDEIMPIV